MGWTAYVVSLAVGLGVGIVYGLLSVRSPAPPIIALLGLLGMLLGESLVAHLRGHHTTFSQLFHTKSFGVAKGRADGDVHRNEVS